MARAVEVENLSKRYRLGEDRPGRSLREAVAGSIRSLGRRRAEREEIWSLRDVSFELEEGGALGVIGRNGAGKSTLLKILSRITEPTLGVSRTRGRVASLLEVGTGFHPELTGKENVYLNGAILGMKRQEMDRRFDEIVDFSGVERFMDTPLKRYSSGMQLRLAFAVAAHLEPDILVVDEILAVGDAEFQRKCLRRMADVEREGRTVVFVSHDLEAIARLCPQVIWLDGGRIQEAGPARRVIDTYLTAALGQESRVSLGAAHGPVKLEQVRTIDDAGKATTVLRRDLSFVIEATVSLAERFPGLDAAIYVVNSAGVRVLDEAWSDTVERRPQGPGRYRLEISVPPVLNVGDYQIGMWIGSAYETVLDEPVTATFELQGSLKGRPDRAVELLLPWAVATADEPVLAPETHPRGA
jgi:ABC-type polysaccharide/polyol phosphate transport system ATPase subunit